METNYWNQSEGMARRAFLSQLMLKAWFIQNRHCRDFSESLKAAWHQMKSKPYNFKQTVLWANTNY